MPNPTRGVPKNDECSADLRRVRFLREVSGFVKADFEKPAEGIGLGHTRARLAGLYGDRASLTLAPAANGRGARVTIGIPSA